MESRSVAKGPMKIGVPKENTLGETRVAIVPETIKRLVAKKVEVSVETRAGEHAYIRDDDYKNAGATIEATTDALFSKADVVLQIHPPTPAQIAKLREGSTLISLLYPLTNVDLVRSLAPHTIPQISAAINPPPPPPTAPTALLSPP